MRGVIKLGSRPKPAPVSPPIEFTVVKTRYGFYRAKCDVTLTKYRVPFFIKEGSKVEVVEDKVTKVLVNIDATRTIYIEAEDFFRDFQKI